MKIYYMNDESVTLTVQINSMPDPDPTVWKHVNYEKLAPQEGRLFEFEAPEGSIPYVKRWNNHIVLLTYISAEAVDRISQACRP